MNDFVEDRVLGAAPGQASPAAAALLTIDAGVAHVRLRALDAAGVPQYDVLVASNRDFATFFNEQRESGAFADDARTPVCITGKLASTVRRALGRGKTFMPAALFWLVASDARAARHAASLALVEISASGYTVIGVNGEGRLKDDLLVVNPRCGAGSGVNVDRVLQKLGLRRDEVDALLADYLGEGGWSLREQVLTRADRCGVFSSSATISDKNQGIPLPVALATTLKSELLKTCHKVPQGFEAVVLCGRFFRWQFVRDCAEDYFASIGVHRVEYDAENTLALDTMARLVRTEGSERIAQPDARLISEAPLASYPAFAELHAQYLADRRYTRAESGYPDASVFIAPGDPVHVGLDVGSTMAKICIADAAGEPLHLSAYGNAGDTIETVKTIFRDLESMGLDDLAVRSIGITGSARYQVREALAHIYPGLSPRINVLVENYAHARGSIDEARRHLAELKRCGVGALNEDFCVLVDVGGEDTKISTIALKEAELFNNAMNIKCSAGTGSLIDTLAALFGLSGPADASKLGYAAPRALAINATCAVFLMENAQRLQAQGVPRGEIIASASWAVVENMARTLWSQVDLPPNCVVLLHGQTMLSDPLPLAITHRLQSFLGRPAYALVPPYPGHRACLGLIRTAVQASVDGVETIALRDFVTARFEKRLVQCKGAACDDADAVCNRTALKCQGADGRQFSFTLGGCSAINELFARSKSRHGETRANAGSDSYKEIWDFIEARQPHSADPRRLVIPRSFVIADWSYFLSQIFTQLGVPVHVDSVQESDLRLGQSLLNIDTCAPQIGAVGQFRRLADEPHGVILAPQIERICTAGKSFGRTCTTNQGGMVVAKTLAEIAHPEARFHLFSFSLERLDAEFVVDQIFDWLQPVFRSYDLAVDRRMLLAVVERAFERHHQLRREAADLAADLIERALAEERQVALVIGRQYVLNPGVYDSHVRRLLRDKRMTAIPSYVLDVELDDAYGGIYWRNSHFIVTVISAVANRTLHQRLSHPRLRALFQRLEERDRLLPVVQISTFLCGPDSVTRHLVAEIMKSRPFLLIQSDAILKELAHLENRVNTYVRQLELGIHARVHAGAKAFDVRLLDSLDHRDRLDRETDVIYFPTISDNRPLTSVLRGAGFTCIDNYRDGDDLHGRVKHGRKFAGDAVCAPLAAVYADLERAVDDFAERKAGDPSFRGKKRLLYADNTGSGPCRQGQYVGVHKLLAHRHMNGACRPDGFVRFLIADEERGYNFGLEEWTLLRVYQAAILQGVLYQLLFASAAECRDVEQYDKLLGEYRALKETLYRRLERFTGPGRLGRALVGAAEHVPWLGAVAKYFAYRLHGRDLQEPLRRFAARWHAHAPAMERLEIRVSGEAYMRVALGEQIFRTLLAQLGFRRFRLELTPLWSYVEYLIEDAMETHRDRLHVARACAARVGTANGANASAIRSARRALRRLGRLRWMLRAVLARPLYHAAGLPLPEPVAEQMAAARAVIPTLRPVGELAPFVGEALSAVRRETDIFLNVAPSGCMVSSMGAAMSPRLNQERAGEPGCIQALFSADGELDEDMLRLALLKSLGPQKFFLRPGIS